MTVDALLGRLHDQTGIAAMLLMAFEAGLLVLQVAVVKLAAAVAVRATFIHGRGSVLGWMSEGSELKRMRFRGRGGFDPFP
jgi:hypothetical protein